MNRILISGASALISMALIGLIQVPEGRGVRGAEPPPPPKAKAKAQRKKEDSKKAQDAGPGGDLQKAYNLLRRIRTDPGGGESRAQERLRGWTDKAVRLYRKGIDAHQEGNLDLAHEYGAMAHDLGKAVDHARYASRLEQSDPDLPTPPAGPGPMDNRDQSRDNLFRAYERIANVRDEIAAPIEEQSFYLKAAADLYNAARRDVEAGRTDRGGELARAAETMTHVVEHLTHALRLQDGGFAASAPPTRRRENPPEPPPRRKDAPPRPGSERSALPPPIE